MRVLVTGGAGFIGSFVTEALLAEGHRVWVVDNLSTGRMEHIPPGVECIVGDVRSPEAWEAGMPVVDAVIHLAGQINVAVSEARPDLDADINLTGTLRMLLLAKKMGAREFRFASSAAVYGDCPDLPLQETAPLHPLSFYGIDKLAAEWAIDHFCQTHAMRAVILRLANVYGPRQRTEGEGGVVAVFAETAARGEAPVIHGDGGQTRDFVFAGDVARAFAWRLGEGEGTLIANISTNTAASVRDIWQKIAGESKLDPQIARFGPPRPGDIRHSRLANDRARAWGFEPRMALDMGLAKTCRHFGAKGSD